MNTISSSESYWRSRSWLRRRCALAGGLVGAVVGVLLVVGAVIGGGESIEGAAYLAYDISRPVIWLLQPIWKGFLLVPIIALAPALNGLVLGWVVGLALGLFPSIGKRRSASA